MCDCDCEYCQYCEYDDWDEIDLEPIDWNELHPIAKYIYSMTRPKLVYKLFEEMGKHDEITFATGR